MSSSKMSAVFNLYFVVLQHQIVNSSILVIVEFVKFDNFTLFPNKCLVLSITDLGNLCIVKFVYCIKNMLVVIFEYFYKFNDVAFHTFRNFIVEIVQ